jgi:hypothetical protein
MPSSSPPATDAAPKCKKPKVDLQELATQVWGHYRDYLDSLEQQQQQQQDQGGDGDIDELQEVIDIAAPHCPKCTNQKLEWRTPTDLLPVLLSVAYYHLADAAIAQYYLSSMQEEEEEDDDDDDKEAQANQVQELLTKSLEWFPENAATWSLGANFGRMSHRLSLPTIRGWYERAVEYASPLRTRALVLLEDDSSEDHPLVNEWVELLILNQVVGVHFETDENDGGANSDQEEIEEEEEEELDGLYSTSAVEATSRFMCAMLSSMEGQHDHALQHLKSFPVTHRLHPNVWTVSNNTQSSDDIPTKPPLVFRPDQGILPESLYQSMKEVFAPDSAYWKDSNYSSRGYYSYFMDYEKDRKQPRNLIEDVIVNHLLPRAKQVLDETEYSSICGYEWWTHTRPIQANLGHNLHFDTEEAMLAQEGKATHPILSSILYLTGGGDDNDHHQPAGATILLDQTPDSETVAERCWQGTPKDNSFLVFPGNLLHGVLPCPGHNTTTNNKGASEATNGGGDVKSREQLLIHDWKEPPKEETVVNRLTFMVGFWTRNVPKAMKERHIYGPCGPLPPATDDHTWVHQIDKGYDNESSVVTTNAEITLPVMALPMVSPAWESIESEEALLLAEEGDEPRLRIPHAIDHRFFVQGAPQCFRDSLFEDREGECE